MRKRYVPRKACAVQYFGLASSKRAFVLHEWTSCARVTASWVSSWVELPISTRCGSTKQFLVLSRSQSTDESSACRLPSLEPGEVEIRAPSPAFLPTLSRASQGLGQPWMDTCNELKMNLRFFSNLAMHTTSHPPKKAENLRLAMFRRVSYLLTVRCLQVEWCYQEKQACS